MIIVITCMMINFWDNVVKKIASMYYIYILYILILRETETKREREINLTT